MASVLIVDDDQLTRRMLRKVIDQGFGAVVHEASDGESALSALESESIDLILLDLSLPTLPGPELLDRLRADPRFASLPVVVITSFSERETVVKLLALGVLDYLRKPINATMARRRLEPVFRRLGFTTSLET